MPPKRRDSYTSEWAGRDFIWFPLANMAPPRAANSPASKLANRPPATRRPPSRNGTGPKSRSPSVATSSIFGVSKRQRRSNMDSIVEEAPIQALITPAIIIDTPAGTDADTKKAGPWSDWHRTRDQKRYWRARKQADDTWTYQFSETKPITTPLPRPPPKPKPTLASFFFGIPTTPLSPPISRPLSANPNAPKPTIFPPPPKEDALSTASDDTTPIKVAARSSGTTFPSSVSTGKGKGSSLSILSENQPSDLSKIELDAPTTKKQLKPSVKSNTKGGKLSVPSPQRGTGTGKRPASGMGMGGTIIALAKPGVAHTNGGQNAKRLDKRVKNEKELRIDTKKRVRVWLKDIGEEAPEPAGWDSEGLPVYK